MGKWLCLEPFLVLFFRKGVTVMKTVSTASDDRTKDQADEFTAQLVASAKNIAALALQKFPGDRKKWQAVLGKGDLLRNICADAVLDKIGGWMDLLLKPVNSKPIVVPAIGEMVITEDLLRKDYNIKDFGENFRRLVFGKTIKAVAAANTTVNALAKDAKLATMYEHVGEIGRVSLSQALWYVSQQKDGQSGHLLVDNYQANFFFVELEVEPRKFETSAVDFDWRRDHGDWDAYAYPLDDSLVWYAGRRVIVSDSKLGA